MNKGDYINFKGNGGWFPGGNQNNNQQTNSTPTTPTPTTVTTVSGRVINTLQDDINADSTGVLNTNFTNFISNLTSDISNFIQDVGNPNVSAIAGFNNFTSIIQTVIQSFLANQTYAYKSSYLLVLGNNQVQQLALNIAVDFGLWFCNGCNTFFNAYSYQQTSNVIVGNTYGTVSNTGNSTYHANSVQNSNAYNTIANINAQMGTANGGGTSADGTAPTVEGLGGFTPEGNPQGSGTTANQVTLNNGAMNNDTNPIANSSADVGGSTTNQMDSVKIATFSQQGFKLFTEKLQAVLYQTFNGFFCSFASIDQDVGGYNG